MELVVNQVSKYKKSTKPEEQLSCTQHSFGFEWKILVRFDQDYIGVYLGLLSIE